MGGPDLKPGWDLRHTKNWTPLNLINCIGKLGEQVVADMIQEERSSFLHHLQYGSVRGRSALDVLYKSVMRVRPSMEGGGSVGWAFWDVKGGFQNFGVRKCWLEWKDALACGAGSLGSKDSCHQGNWR